MALQPLEVLKSYCLDHGIKLIGKDLKMKKFDKKHVDFEGIMFVTKAVLKKNPRRPVLHNLFVAENRELVATDGHRCHKYELQSDELVPGLYQIIKNTKSQIILAPAEDDGVFPDYTKVFPEPGETISFGELGTSNEHCAIALTIRAMPNNTLNIDYLRDALTGMSEVQASDGIGSVCLRGERRSAVIMPIRM
jgi:hypothetical protein